MPVWVLQSAEWGRVSCSIGDYAKTEMATWGTFDGEHCKMPELRAISGHVHALLGYTLLLKNSQER